MNSTNGTYLNGDRLDADIELAHLDVIEIGDTELRFELGET
jgi:pSer/pThr/pTyr-binding forkhead associated (FHA) protein